MKKRSLLQQASNLGKARKLKRKIAEGELELVVAYTRGEITFSQVREVLIKAKLVGMNNGSVTHRVAALLREACMSGKIKIVKL